MRLALKAVSLVIIVAALFYYNQMITLSLELTEANSAIEELEASRIAAQNASGTALSGEVAEEIAKYKDGIYSGTARGYGGPVTMRITVTGGKISGIEITSSDGEDAAYYNMCLGILDEIAKNQDADVDTVAGATLTSDGIIGGAREALAQAVNE
jgi:uncharacterized protein with FMN-binding domain